MRAERASLYSADVQHARSELDLPPTEVDKLRRTQAVAILLSVAQIVPILRRRPLSVANKNPNATSWIRSFLIAL